MMHTNCCRPFIAMLALMLIASEASVFASAHRGLVRFNGRPLPGATVTATRNGIRLSAVTSLHGVYAWSDLEDGPWALRIEMSGFQPRQTEIRVESSSPDAVWEMSMLPFSGMNAEALGNKDSNVDSIFPTIQAKREAGLLEPDGKSEKRTEAPSGVDARKKDSDSFSRLSPEQLSERAADGFLINGSVNNGAASASALHAAFGNKRRSQPLYNGGLNIGLNNSAFDARPFSLTGENTPKRDYLRTQMGLTFGGPLNILRRDRSAKHFFASYQMMRDRNAAVATGRMPAADERAGDFSGVRDALGRRTQIFDPETLLPFENNRIPQERISSQARAMLSLFPWPNSRGSGAYNYQVATIADAHQDILFGRLIGESISAGLNYVSRRADAQNLFGFVDRGRHSSIEMDIGFVRSLGRRTGLDLQYRFGRSSSRTVPHFSGRANISGAFGIMGNNQDPVNWGPPNLLFSNYARLTEAQSACDRDLSHKLSGKFHWTRGSHQFGIGVDFRRQQLNFLSQQDARGTFTFTGAASGYDFADFLLGIPDASSIAFGNADKYFRASSYAAYINDDWRIGSGLTLNGGVRWEYEAPFTELYGRLVNLDVTPDFSWVKAVTGNMREENLAGRRYPTSLIRPDKSGIEPRIGFAWRPSADSSIVVRGGYGIYRETSVYLPLAQKMAQQAPFSKSLSADSSGSHRLTLADGFHVSAEKTGNTFGVDPKFRVGFAHSWQWSIQMDLPFYMQMTAEYTGARGSHLTQRFYPNTYPEGGTGCAACVSGFMYVSSNGTSIRHAGYLQLRRRLGSGFMGDIQYAFSKSIDDAGLGGSGAAQNWLDLKAERALSGFNQKHLVKIHAQYTTGSGVYGSRLLNGWKALALKEWTIAGDMKAGSGLPLTPRYAAVSAGAGNTGNLRPSLTGVPVNRAPGGLFLNPAAYAPPASGEWGNAGRNSIAGPGQFDLNASLGRVFRSGERYTIEFRLESTNILNHPVPESWNTTTNSSLFGVPDRFCPMRKVQANLRVNF